MNVSDVANNMHINIYIYNHIVDWLYIYIYI